MSKYGPLVKVGETARGHTIWREPNGAGGFTYWSDSIGDGVVVWDTCLVSREELEIVMRLEAERAAEAAIPYERAAQTAEESGA